MLLSELGKQMAGLLFKKERAKSTNPQASPKRSTAIHQAGGGRSHAYLYYNSKAKEGWEMLLYFISPLLSITSLQNCGMQTEDEEG